MGYEHVYMLVYSGYHTKGGHEMWLGVCVCVCVHMCV